MAYATEFTTFTVKAGMEAKADERMRVLVKRDRDIPSVTFEHVVSFVPYDVAEAIDARNAPLSAE